MSYSSERATTSSHIGNGSLINSIKLHEEYLKRGLLANTAAIAPETERQENNATGHIWALNLKIIVLLSAEQQFIKSIHTLLNYQILKQIIHRTN